MANERLDSRRDFMKKAVTTSVAAGGLVILGARPSKGADKKEFKVGLVGCGGRGTGALGNCVEAAKYLGSEIKVVSLADGYEDRARRLVQSHNVPHENVHVGFDAYQKLLKTDVEVVLLATPPAFRPLHLEAAINAGKHVFMEKPVAVDPAGCRKVMEVGELAKKKGLCIVAGTQRRHSRHYRELKKAIDEGAIGKIRGGAIYWCGGALWRRERDPAWSDAEYMVRNWVSFSQLSGDHIVEQHVHNIDIMNWFMNGPPVSALGFGLRARRKTGNQFDFFSIDFEYPEGVHIHSMCRQIDGTGGDVSEHLVGEKGVAHGLKPKDTQVFPEGCPEYTQDKERDYVQEHIDLLWHISKGHHINEAHNVATSTAIAIMGRISAYTGKKVHWKEMMEPSPEAHKPEFFNLAMSPSAEDFEKGTVKAPPDDVFPLPGRAS
jgi:myo-inositol 2-dehydrogenase/D-chiro-inositol 1-dehydrogenase